jgi:hypothetical protein
VVRLLPVVVCVTGPRQAGADRQFRAPLGRPPRSGAIRFTALDEIEPYRGAELTPEMRAAVERAKPVSTSAMGIRRSHHWFTVRH